MQSFIDQLKDHLSHNRSAVVLDLLPTIFRQKEEAFNMATLLRGRYSKIREEHLGNLLTEEEASVEYTKINNSILSLLEETEGLVFDVPSAQKLLDDLLAEGEKWRVREGLLDRIRQSQSESIKEHFKDDAIVSHRVTSKAAVWVVVPMFLIFAVAFLVLAIKSPSGCNGNAVPANNKTRPKMERPVESSKPTPSQAPKKQVPPPLKDTRAPNKN